MINKDYLCMSTLRNNKYRKNIREDAWEKAGENHNKKPPKSKRNRINTKVLS